MLMQTISNDVDIMTIRPIYSEFQSKCRSCGGVFVKKVTVGIMNDGTYECPFCGIDLYINPKTLFRDNNGLDTVKNT